MKPTADKAFTSNSECIQDVFLVLRVNNRKLGCKSISQFQHLRNKTLEGKEFTDLYFYSVSNQQLTIMYFRCDKQTEVNKVQ